MENIKNSTWTCGSVLCHYSYNPCWCERISVKYSSILLSHSGKLVLHWPGNLERPNISAAKYSWSAGSCIRSTVVDGLQNIKSILDQIRSVNFAYSELSFISIIVIINENTLFISRNRFSLRNERVQQFSDDAGFFAQRNLSEFANYPQEASFSQESVDGISNHFIEIVSTEWSPFEDAEKKHVTRLYFDQTFSASAVTKVSFSDRANCPYDLTYDLSLKKCHFKSSFSSPFSSSRFVFAIIIYE